VRESACYGLDWLHAKGELVEPKLVKLCREDPSPGVRVWAAVALRGSHAQDAIAAYQAGLKSTDRKIWQLCEEELDKTGKLELPLPEHIYSKISPEEYRSMTASAVPRIGREITKGGMTYFEHCEGGRDGIPVRTEWYQVKLPNKQ
jgi:hypothetical protein